MACACLRADLLQAHPDHALEAHTPDRAHIILLRVWRSRATPYVALKLGVSAARLMVSTKLTLETEPACGAWHCAAGAQWKHTAQGGASARKGDSLR
jgi:hypothetical protein